MALVPCSACKRRTVGKLIALYTARFAEDRRVAFKTKLCYSCAADYANTIRAAKPIPGDQRDTDWPETCSVCGTSTAEDLDPIYVTIYEPKQDGRSLTIPTCGTCSINVAVELERFGERLLDRPVNGAANGTGHPAAGEGAPSPLAWG